MKRPRPARLRWPEFVRRNERSDVLGWRRAGHAKLGIRDEPRVREQREHITAGFVAKAIVAVTDALERRGSDERCGGIEVVAVAVEQPQRERLVVHARPGVEEFVASAPEREAGVATHATDDAA